ncbi:uncharacterized protein LOC135210508 [Macrobrachium nipponense]|uniref:uncharacterized protein LOC135210508 n=1 Tax=Macrobrachium nipponense TaxID=159736 RepID=UPI0030C7FCD3
MKSTVLTTLTFFIAMGSTLAMSRLKRSGHWEDDEKECKDPSMMMTKMIGMMCDDAHCAEYAPKCVKAMMPPGDMCTTMKECKQELNLTMGAGHDATNKQKMMTQYKKPLMECCTKKHMKALGMEYVPDNLKANTLALMKKSVSMSTELTDKTKNDMLSAMDGACAMPSGSYKMMDMAMSSICLTKTCVNSMTPK